MCDIPDEDEVLCSSIVFGAEEIIKKCVPTQTQIRQELGSKLSDVFFEFLNSEGRAYKWTKLSDESIVNFRSNFNPAFLQLGLEPSLNGPDSVWLSPASRTQNKVVFTPVPDPEILHLKALTHGSILEVGQNYVEKLENKHRMELAAALDDQEKSLMEEWRKKLGDSGDFNPGKGASSMKKVVATLMEHFDTCFNDLVKTTQLRMRKECQKKVEEERAELAAYMFSQLKGELRRQDRELCNEFHGILYSELNLLANRYIQQINKEREVAVQLMRETVKNYEKMLQDIRTEMELSNVVDVCQAITSERIECNERIKKIREEMRQNDNQEVIAELQKENCILQKMATERLKRMLQWRKKVRVILEEFQKFINFALKAVPGQAEYFLDMEKLLLRKYPEDSFLLPEDYMRFKDCMKEKLSFSDEEPPKKDQEVCDEPKPEISGESDSLNLGGYCQSIDYKEEDEEETGLTFDYNTFKTMLINKFAFTEAKGRGKKGGRRWAISLWKKKSKAVLVDKNSEMYKKLTLAGENEKEHLAPASCFLRKRLDTVVKVCKDDPEFAKIMLGCPDK